MIIEKIKKIWVDNSVDRYYIKEELENALRRNRLEKEIEKMFYSVDFNGYPVYCSNEFKIVRADESLNWNSGYVYTIDGDKIHAYDLNNETYF